MKDKQRWLKYLPAIIDVCLIIIAYFLAYYLRFYRPIFREELGYYYPLSHYAIFLFYIIPTYLIIYYKFRLYSAKLDERIWNKILSLIMANIVGMILFMFVLFIMKEYNISRKFILLFHIINIVLGSAARMVTGYRVKKKLK